MSREVSHESLDNIINEYANVKTKNEVPKKPNKKGRKIDIPFILCLILIFACGLFCIMWIIEKNNVKIQYKTEYKECESECPIYDKQKLKFYDDSIVFVIEGFGNYYYTYDCMMQKVNSNYTYWAYNREAAIAKGYHEGRCD